MAFSKLAELQRELARCEVQQGDDDDVTPQSGIV